MAIYKFRLSQKIIVCSTIAGQANAKEFGAETPARDLSLKVQLSIDKEAPLPVSLTLAAPPPQDTQPAPAAEVSPLGSLEASEGAAIGGSDDVQSPNKTEKSQEEMGKVGTDHCAWNVEDLLQF